MSKQKSRESNLGIGQSSFKVEYNDSLDGLVMGITIPNQHKPINHSSVGIKRLDFLYDNDKIYCAGAVKKVNFNAKDVDGNDCIEYSSKTQGVCRVYRIDLAAIGITYQDDTFIAKKLIADVVFGEMEVRMKRKSTKT